MKESDGCGESSAEQKGASAQKCMGMHKRRKNQNKRSLRRKNSKKQNTVDAGDVVRDAEDFFTKLCRPEVKRLVDARLNTVSQLSLHQMQPRISSPAQRHPRVARPSAFIVRGGGLRTKR